MRTTSLKALCLAAASFVWLGCGGGTTDGTGGGSAGAGGGTSAAGGGTTSAGGGTTATGGGHTDAGTGGGTTATGGGHTDAGTGGGTSATGGGTADAGTGTGCPNANAFFCEDFESYAMGAATTNTKWSTETANGTLTIDQGQARGTRALHVHTVDNGRARIQLKNFSPPSNSFYARAYVYVTAFPTAPDYAHFTMVEASGTGNSTLVRPLGGQYIPPSTGKTCWGVGSDSGPTGDWCFWKTTSPTTTGWSCVEFQVDASTDGVNLWFNGTPHTDLSVSKNHHGNDDNVDFVFPTFNALWFGWWLYQGGSTPGTYDLWFDDIALSANRLPCP